MSNQIVDPRALHATAINIRGVPVQLVVGPNEDSIVVHSSVLDSSEFFKTALKNEWNEGQSHTIKLPDDRIETVEAYVQWLYTSLVHSGMPGFNHNAQYIYLVELYAFAEKILDTKLQNAIIDAIVATNRHVHDIFKKSYYPRAMPVNIIYKTTPQSSPLRKLVVDMWHDYGEPVWMPDTNFSDDSKLPYEFLEDLTLAVLERSKLPDKDAQRGEGIKEGVPSAYYKSSADKIENEEKAEPKEASAEKKTTVPSEVWQARFNSLFVRQH